MSKGHILVSPVLVNTDWGYFAI